MYSEHPGGANILLGDGSARPPGPVENPDRKGLPMTILFDARHPVKSRNLVFGLGLGMIQPERLPIGPSHDDAAWWATESNQHARDHEVDLATCSRGRFSVATSTKRVRFAGLLAGLLVGYGQPQVALEHRDLVR
jgi:prepilin-type processing-associated H-X9-DG protein